MVLWDSIQYRGSEINILPKSINATCGAPVGPDNRFRFPIQLPSRSRPAARVPHQGVHLSGTLRM